MEKKCLTPKLAKVNMAYFGEYNPTDYNPIKTIFFTIFNISGTSQ